VKLSKCKPGDRVRLSTGQLVVVSGPAKGDVRVRDVLDANWEWAKGRFGDRLGELYNVGGDEPVEKA
jgi:hypothetical protein